MAQEIGQQMTENARRVSPAPDVSRLSSSELCAALRTLPYRESAFLVLRLVRGRTPRLLAMAAFVLLSLSGR